jgi:hypothetical protein
MMMAIIIILFNYKYRERDFIFCCAGYTAHEGMQKLVGWYSMTVQNKSDLATK